MSDRTKFGGALLVLDGALSPPAAALVLGGRVAGETAAPRRPARGSLLDAAMALLADRGLRPGDLGAVGVATGPGSFTGLRIALAAARGLRLAAGPRLALLAADTPRLLAAAAGVRLPAVVAIPWGRLRVLLARADKDGPSPLGPGLVARDALPAVAFPPGLPVVAPAGSDLRFPGGVTVVPAVRSTGGAFLRLLAAGGVESVEDGRPVPVYLVPPDAVPRRPREPARDDFTVRPLAPEEIGEAAAIERESFATPWTESMLRGEVEAPGAVALGLRDAGGKLVGFALARGAAGVLSLHDIAVAPASRGRGAGRALLRALVARAEAAGFDRVELEVRPSNTAAVRLYMSEGFVFVGRRRRYYPDGEDALLMTRLLRRAP